MDTTSPPLTPIRQYMSPLDTSPTTLAYREQFRRRTSSFSSHPGSPATPRMHKRNQYSNASQLSNDAARNADDDGQDGAYGNGMGNLADELDQLDDEEEMTMYEDEEGAPPRDSGIDVSYATSEKSAKNTNFSKPFAAETGDDDEMELSPDLDTLMNSIARMASTHTPTTEDPLIPRVLALLQDLGNQASLEAGAQRLTTSTNSQASYLMAQSKMLQNFSTSLLSPFAFYTPLDPEAIEAAIPLVDALLQDLPLPDPAAVQGITSLDHANEVVLKKLSEVTDTIQMGKQDTNNAARHLRTTQTMVADLRREREKAELARQELQQRNVGDDLKMRTCAAECRDVMSGFEDFCDALRERLVVDEAHAAAA